MSTVDSCASQAARNRIVWIDLEMTGLDDTKDHILEAACLVTDADLTVIAEGPNIIVNQPDHILESMGDWCKQHHGKSGLTEASRRSSVNIKQAEQMLLEFLEMHTNPGECPLAGNSIGEDKRFLYRYMPNLIQHLHYRIIDVSTIKELCKRWYPDVAQKAPKKKLAHRALDDIKESLTEMKFYRTNIFTRNYVSTDL